MKLSYEIGGIPVKKAAFLCITVFSLIALMCISASAAELTTPKNMTQHEVEERLDELIELVDKKYFTTSGVTCNKTFENGHGCEKCLLARTLRWNYDNTHSQFYKLVDGFVPTAFSSRSTKEFTHYYNGRSSSWYRKGYSCCGFANYAGWYIFAQKKTDKVIFKWVIDGDAPRFNAKTMSKALPGDLLRLGDSRSTGTHSAVFLEKVDGGVKVLDANGGGKQCQIKVRTISYSSYNYVGISRAQNYQICDHDFEKGYCTNCNERDPALDTYLKNLQSQSKFWNSDVWIRVTESATVKSYPLAPDSGNDSEDVYTPEIGDILKVTGIYQNELGNYWYAVVMEDKRVLFFYCGRGEVIRPWDAEITDVRKPPNIKQSGASFSPKGTVKSSNRMEEIGLYVYKGTATSGSAVLKGTADISKTAYDLSGSAVAQKLDFSELTDGSYNYVIKAAYRYYDSDGKTLNTLTSPLQVVYQSPFEVEYHFHAYAQTVVPPTCTEDGYTINTCSGCKDSYVSHKTEATGHSWQDNPEIIGIPCLEGEAFLHLICETCGEEEFGPIAGSDHLYVDGFDDCCFYCGMLNPDAAAPALKQDVFVNEGVLDLQFGAAGLGMSTETEYLSVVAFYDSATGQLLEVQTVPTTAHGLSLEYVNLAYPLPEDGSVFWKSILLDENYQPVCEAVSDTAYNFTMDAE